MVAAWGWFLSSGRAVDGGKVGDLGMRNEWGFERLRLEQPVYMSKALCSNVSERVDSGSCTVLVTLRVISTPLARSAPN